MYIYLFIFSWKVILVPQNPPKPLFYFCFQISHLWNDLHVLGSVLTPISDRFFLKHESSYGNDTWLCALSISYPWQSVQLKQAGMFSICGIQLRLSFL